MCSTIIFDACIASEYRIKLIDQRTLPNLGGGNAAEDKDDSADEADMAMPNMAGTDFKPTKVNPHFLMLYGHIMACGKSYQSAIGECVSWSFAGVHQGSG